MEWEFGFQRCLPGNKRLNIPVSVLLHCQYITLLLKLVFDEFEFCVFSMFFKRFLLWFTKT